MPQATMVMTPHSGTCNGGDFAVDCGGSLVALSLPAGKSQQSLEQNGNKLATTNSGSKGRLATMVVYNTNELAKLVENRKSLENWFVYYENKSIRNPNKRPTTKTGLFGILGKTVDAIDYYKAEIEKLRKEEAAERERIISDPAALMPVAFVSFKSRWGAAVCAQTQQSSNPTLWLTDWAPEPRDVYWSNLSIPFVELTIRRFLMAVALFFLTFFFMIPIAFVQSLANIEGIEKVMPFLRPVMEWELTKSFIQGILPGIALKIFLILLPTILMTMSKIEGYISLSSLDRRSASKYYLFILVNVFLGSVITGTAFQQLDSFLHQSADAYVKILLYLLSCTYREQAMDPGCLEFASSEPRIQLYFLLGFVYFVVAPIFLPFLLVFFGLAYVVFRHQIINVYNQQYESAAAFWPDVVKRVIIAMIISQLLLMGLMSTKDGSLTIPILVLPLLTIWFHIYCKTRFEPAFVKFPLQDAMVKDTLERATEPLLNLRAYLQDAYVHPDFHREDIERPLAIDEEENNLLVPTKRTSYRSTPKDSKYNSEIGSDCDV
ncbi:hypothetical protein ZIOFF_060294 [Zingiber officinale]|uniref:CSC1-like protein n=1 Tax=Zingiber officinale TaxID=94328 RepID=A0A8J5F6D5_ZINOF|nr:hypothetical protein ZIOFF_060294 [Zingiber officinale]